MTTTIRGTKLTEFRRVDDRGKRVLSVTVYDEQVHDDLSELGRIDDQPGPDAIKLKGRRVIRGRFRDVWFTPAMTGAQTGSPDSPRQDMRRFIAYEIGEWCYLHIYAVATVVICGTIQKIVSGGISHVESDSDEIASHRLEEVSALREIVDAMGFPMSEFDAAAGREPGPKKR